MTQNLDFGTNNRTIILMKESGTVVKLKPTTFGHIDDILQLLETLLVQYFHHDGALGTIFRPSNRTTWDAIAKLLDFHTLVGGGKLGMEDLSHLDIDDLRRLFLTQTETTNELGHSKPEDKRLAPCMLSVLNGLDFLEILRQAIHQDLNTNSSLTEQTLPA